MITFIELSDDGDDVNNFVNFKTEEEAFAYLKQYVENAYDLEEMKGDPRLQKLEEAKTLQDLNEWADGFFWGENDRKMVHIIRYNGDMLKPGEGEIKKLI